MSNRTRSLIWAIEIFLFIGFLQVWFGSVVFSADGNLTAVTFDKKTVEKGSEPSKENAVSAGSREVKITKAAVSAKVADSEQTDVGVSSTKTSKISKDKPTEDKKATQPTALVGSEKSDSKSKDEKGGRNLDTIMTTFEETLKENQRLRAEIESMGTTISKGYIENNALKARVTKVQADMDQYKATTEEKFATVTKELAAERKRASELELGYKTMSEEKKTAEEKAAQASEESAKIKQLLGKSILESERDEYQKLITESQKTADRSVEELGKVRGAMEAMQNELAELHLEIGNSLFQEKKYERALEEYERVLELNPQERLAHYNSAIVYDYYLGNSEKAIDHYQKYLEMKPAQKEMRRIRERVLQLELEHRTLAGEPLKSDFDTKILKKESSVSWM